MRLLDSLSTVAGAKGVSESSPKQNQSQTGFETFLAEADRRQQPQVTDMPGRNRDDNRQQRVSNREEESRASRRDERGTRNNTAQAAESQESAAAVPTEPTAPVNEVEIDENQAAASVAAILQVPVEAVLDWLAQLDMTAEDLLDPQNVTKLLQLALDAETPAQLLTDSQFPEMFKAINEAMAELLQEAEVQVTIAAASDGVRAQTTLLAETEGLQVVVEDGEVIVTDQFAPDEFENEENASQNSSANPRQATAQTSEATTIQPTAAADVLPTEAPDILPNQPQITPAMINMANAKVAVEAAIQQATTPTNINPADVIDQIMNQVKITSSGGNFSEMRMTLSPESLGDIVLRVMTQNGIVTAMFEAENQRVKETLEASFNQLRDALQDQGIQFSELSVSVRQEGNERMNQFEYARQAARRRMERLNRIGEAEEVEEQPIAQRHNGVIDVTA